MPQEAQKEATALPVAPAAPDSRGGDGASNSGNITVQLTPEQYRALQQQIENDATPSADDVQNEVRQLMEASERAQQQRQPPVLNGDPRVGAQRDTDGPDGAYLQLWRMFGAMANRNQVRQWEIVSHMHRAGMYNYDDPVLGRIAPPLTPSGSLPLGSRAVAVTGSEGTPFLPTMVENRIEELREELGIARQLCTVFRITSGSVKVPNSTARPSVYAVSEGGEIKMRKPTTGSVTLDPYKWGVIVGYTTEMTEEVGAQWTRMILDQIGRAYAEMEDATVWTADGTSAYNSLTGLLNKSTIAVNSLATNEDSMQDAEYDDYMDLVLQAAVGGRTNGVFVLHPDHRILWAKFQDGAGNYIFPPNQEITRLIRPAYFSEALPGIDSDAAGLHYAIFGDHSFVNLGIQRGVEVKLLDQATIKDTDDSTLVHLGLTDSLALRFTAKWDVKYAIVNAFARMRTANT